ncbi:MAG TPA: TetR/AcrR family transcriptional regulator [Acidimicrobiales bacterium]
MTAAPAARPLGSSASSQSPLDGCAHLRERADGDDDEIVRRIRLVPRPHPRLSRERSLRLTARQREILDQLTELFAEGFAQLTMADLAARLNCSLRTLYSLATSRDELVLMVVDRNLWRIGRTATAAVAASEGGVTVALDAIRSYLAAAHVAVSNTSEVFARDMAAVPGGPELRSAHASYLVAVTRELLEVAIERGEIAQVNTTAVARVIASIGHHLAEPDVIATLHATPQQAADEVVDLVLAGLAARSPA